MNEILNQIIKPESVEFDILASKNNISINYQSEMINLLEKELTEEEYRWYKANLYIDMNYHPTNDFPINLNTVVKIIGFAHHKNARRILENNFTINEDYTVRIYGKEIVMLNITTFKNICLTAKTDKAKKIKKYYIKLENIYNNIIKKQIG